MLECTGALCIDTIGVLCRFESSIAIVFLVSDEIILAAASSIMLRDAGGVKVDASISLFWCL